MKKKELKCDGCNMRSYCVNPTAVEKGSVEDCFIAPDCTKCQVNTHCKNKNLPDVVFGLTPGSVTPDCFSGYHSSK